MVICPECQFENPDANKYCQSCGTSLTHKTCHHCGANISLQAETCKYCGASVETVLWAIVTTKSETDSKAAVAKSTLPLSTNRGLVITELSDSLGAKLEEATVKTAITKYLDTRKRYRLDVREQKYDELGNQSVVEFKVVDCQPLQKTYLRTLQEQQPELFDELEQNLKLFSPSQWQEVGIPAQALPYLQLQQFSPVIPEIYDTWQNNGQGVLLLPDRTQYQLLTQQWLTPNVPLLQILWLLDQMAKLWKPLLQINCGQSLLKENNLRLDEDQSFCLQKLYEGTPDTQPSLSELAQTWQQWLVQSKQENYLPLKELLEQVITGKITTIEELREQLYLIEPEFGVAYDFNSVDDSQTEAISASPSVDESNSDNNFELFTETDSKDYLLEDSDEAEPTVMIPMQLAKISDAGGTDIGSQRNHNEDFFWIETKISRQENGLESNLQFRGLYIVCDGMGGHAAGEVASAMAVETLQKYLQTHWQEELPAEDVIKAAILHTNQTIYQNNLDHARAGNGRMGTTLVMALIQDTRVAIAHVGDSRIYRLTRQQGLEQLTLDHEVGQREINRGVEPEIAYARPDAYQLTQALGPRDNQFIRPDIQYLNIGEDTLLLLCSDGLCDNNLLENHWEDYLTPLMSSSRNLEKGLFKLIDFANQYNGHDNITAILVRLKFKPNV